MTTMTTTTKMMKKRTSCHLRVHPCLFLCSSETGLPGSVDLLCRDWHSAWGPTPCFCPPSSRLSGFQYPSQPPVPAGWMLPWHLARLPVWSTCWPPPAPCYRHLPLPLSARYSLLTLLPHLPSPSQKNHLHGAGHHLSPPRC